MALAHGVAVASAGAHLVTVFLDARAVDVAHVGILGSRAIRAHSIVARGSDAHREGAALAAAGRLLDAGGVEALELLPGHQPLGQRAAEQLREHGRGSAVCGGAAPDALGRCSETLSVAHAGLSVGEGVQVIADLTDAVGLAQTGCALPASLVDTAAIISDLTRLLGSGLSDQKQED